MGKKKNKKNLVWRFCSETKINVRMFVVVRDSIMIGRGS